MFKLNSLPAIQRAAYGLCFAFLVAILLIRVAPAAPSLVMIGFFLLAIQRQRIAPNFQFFRNHKAYLSITGIFFIFIISGLWSSWTPYFFERLRIAIPFLVMPFAFASLPSITQRQYFSIFYVLILLMTLTCIGVGINYFLNLEVITKSIGQGKAMPVPINHIRFSLLAAFTILVGILLVRKQFYWKYTWERWMIGGLTFFLFGFIHVLSVRSGLLVLYLSLFVVAVRYVLTAKKYWMLLVVGLGILAAPTIAYYTLPSFKIKVDYVKYDLEKFNEGNIQSHSDSERLTSLQVGLKVGNQSPIIGVGLGDLKTEIKKIYAQDYPNLKAKMPHNQFIFFYAATGLVGVFTFLGLFFYPLFYNRNYKYGIFTALHVMIFFSFMVENTINTALGTGIYIFFLLLSLNYIEGLKHNQSPELAVATIADSSISNRPS